MTKKTVSVDYNVVWELEYAPQYQFTEHGKCFNAQTGKELTMKLNGYTKGFNIKGRFRSLLYLRGKLRKIEKINIPF